MIDQVLKAELIDLYHRIGDLYYITRFDDLKDRPDIERDIIYDIKKHVQVVQGLLEEE